MMRPENHPPKDCGNFLADLPKYLGLDDPSFQKEQIYSHYSSCTRCRQNLGTAREMAGAFTGLKPRIAVSSAAQFSVGSRMQTIEKAVRLALDSNRTELSQVFTNLGKSLYIEALKLNEAWDPKWVSTGPLRDVGSYRRLGMDLANDSVLFCKDAQEKGIWKESQEELARTPVQSAWQGCLDESLRYLVVARRVDPRNESATIHLAQTYFLRKDLGSAVEALTKVLQESDRLARIVEARNNLGGYLLEMGRLSEALAHSSEAHRLNPEEPTVACNFANYLLLSEKRDEAFRAYSEIEEKPVFTHRAEELLGGVCRKSLAPYFKRSPKDLDRLGKDFPKIFAPETVRRIREEVQS